MNIELKKEVDNKTNKGDKKRKKKEKKYIDKKSHLEIFTERHEKGEIC